MPDEPTPEEESVRRLLAASAGPEPLPAEVASRLDDVLAGLVADRVSARRRRALTVALVAAASVAVVGLGVGTVVRSGGQDATSASGASADRAAGPEAARAPVVHSRSLAADVQRLADSVPVTVAGAAGDLSAAECAVPPLRGRAQAIAIRLDGRVATLVLRPPHGRTRQAQVYACDDATAPVAQTRVHVHRE